MFPVISVIPRLNAHLSRLPWTVPALFARIVPATIFWQSGQTKLDGWHVSDGAYQLFIWEYGFHPAIAPAAATLAAISEHLFPVFLILGLMTRLSALALLVMTCVIEWVYPDAWQTHGLWAAAFLALVAKGPGRLSLDAALGLDR